MTSCLYITDQAKVMQVGRRLAVRQQDLTLRHIVNMKHAEAAPDDRWSVMSAIIVIMQHLTHHVSVIRMTNRRCGAICGLAILLFVWWFVCSNDNDRTDDKLSDNSADEAEHPKYTV